MRAVAIQHRDEAPTLLDLDDPVHGDGEIRVAVARHDLGSRVTSPGGSASRRPRS